MLLVAIQNGESRWSGYFGFERGTVYSIIDDTPPEAVIRADPVEAGPKIEGPWLWMIAPTESRAGVRVTSSKDWLAAASGGAVTETTDCQQRGNCRRTPPRQSMDFGETRIDRRR